MPIPSQIYATDRNGLIQILDPTTLALASSSVWVRSIYRPAPGPALFALAYEATKNYLYAVGLPNGTNSSFYALTPTLQGALYDLQPAGAPIPMPVVQAPTNLPDAPQMAFQPDYIAIDSVNSRVFVADPLRCLSVWDTTNLAPVTGSPYYPSGGRIRAQGVAYDSINNRVYILCQNTTGQSQLAVYDASTMNQVVGSPFALPNGLDLSQSRSSIVYDAPRHHILITSNVGLTVLNDSSPYSQIAGSPFSTGGLDARAMALDLTNNRVYVCNFGSDTLSALLLTTFAPVSGSPYATGHGPKSVVYNPAKNWVYVANYNLNPGGITVYNAASLPMPAIGSFQTSTSFIQLAIGP